MLCNTASTTTAAAAAATATLNPQPGLTLFTRGAVREVPQNDGGASSHSKKDMRIYEQVMEAYGSYYIQKVSAIVYMVVFSASWLAGSKGMDHSSRYVIP